MFSAAVRLLHNHGESLDPLQVLEVSFFSFCFIVLYYVVLPNAQMCNKLVKTITGKNDLAKKKRVIAGKEQCHQGIQFHMFSTHLIIKILFLFLFFLLVLSVFSFLLLQRLSPEMPLQLATDTILRMLRARVHHHRQGQVRILFIALALISFKRGWHGEVLHCK